MMIPPKDMWFGTSPRTYILRGVPKSSVCHLSIGFEIDLIISLSCSKLLHSILVPKGVASLFVSRSSPTLQIELIPLLSETNLLFYSSPIFVLHFFGLCSFLLFLGLMATLSTIVPMTIKLLTARTIIRRRW